SRWIHSSNFRTYCSSSMAVPARSNRAIHSSGSSSTMTAWSGDLVEPLVDRAPDDPGVTIDVSRRQIGGGVAASIDRWASRLQLVVAWGDKQRVRRDVAVGPL